MNFHYVFTRNRFNQVLIFESYEKAFDWLSSSTNWSVKKIKDNIKQARKSENTMYCGCLFE